MYVNIHTHTYICTYIHTHIHTYIQTLHTGKELFLCKGEGHYEIILCLYYCSISWITFHLNGLAAKRTWKVHTDGFSAVGPDGFSAVSAWQASGFTLRRVQQHISLGGTTTWEYDSAKPLSDFARCMAGGGVGTTRRALEYSHNCYLCYSCICYNPTRQNYDFFTQFNCLQRNWKERGQKIVYCITQTFIISNALPFFPLRIQVSICCHFPSAWRTSFSIYRNADLLVTNYFNFLLSENVFFALIFEKYCVWGIQNKVTPEAFTLRTF